MIPKKNSPWKILVAFLDMLLYKKKFRIFDAILIFASTPISSGSNLITNGRGRAGQEEEYAGAHKSS